MKGFIITLDSAIALSFVLFAILIISSQTYNPRAPGSIYLKQLTLDTINVLERSGRVGLALEGNTSATQEILETTPRLACIKVSIINGSGTAVASVLKYDCNQSAELDIQTSSNIAVYQGKEYIIKSDSWFRSG